MDFKRVHLKSVHDNIHKEENTALVLFYWTDWTWK